MKKTTYLMIFLVFAFLNIARSQATDFVNNNSAEFAFSVADTARQPQSFDSLAKIPVPPQYAGVIVGQCIVGIGGGILSGFVVGIPSGFILLSGRVLGDYHTAIFAGLVTLAYDFGVSGVITLMGNTDDIKGDFGYTFFGALAGTAASGAFFWAGTSTKPRNDILLSAAAATFIIGPVIGAMIGYSSTRHWVRQPSYYQHTENIEKKQEMYSRSFARRISAGGLSFDLKQNPYKIISEPMVYMNMLTVRF
jgi:hypothetical protein